MWQDRLRLFTEFLCLGTALALFFQRFLPPWSLEVLGGILAMAFVAFRVVDAFPKPRSGQVGQGDVGPAPHPGGLLREALNERGLNATEAARLLGVSPSSL